MLQTVFDSSFDCIKVLDLDGKLLSINKPGCRLLEIDRPEDVIGQSWVELWHGGDGTAAREAVRRAAGGEHSRFEGYGPTLKGTPKWWETTVSPIVGASGKPEGLIAISRDVTERVLREREARDAARLASRAKDEFLATLAHELRNPLAAVTHAVATLDRIGSQANEATHARAVIRRQTDHLAALLDDLLDITRIGEGKLGLLAAPVDLREVVERAVEAEAPRVHARQQSIDTELPRTAVVVSADFARMRQVVANLVGNASKYTPPGGKLRVRLGEDDGQARLDVMDNGVGIPPDMLDQVFEIFVQVRPTGARSEGGLGIGLALVKRLVQLHRGTVSCSSEGEGRGTCMTVRLPMLQGVKPAQAPAPEPAAAAPLNLLVVEDGDDAREMLVLTMQLMGHAVRGAASASEALAAAKSDVHDAIVLDIGLPDMDGCALARLLRDSVGPDVVLLALSGYGQEEDRRRSLDSGFDAHLVKPVAPAQLLRAIDEAMAARKAPARPVLPTTEHA